MATDIEMAFNEAMNLVFERYGQQCDDQRRYSSIPRH
jgi:hypothetical protein